MKGLNKLKKLLCYLIISIFMFGIGGEVVKAANEMQITGVTWLGSYNKFDAMLYGEHRYAYCIDAPKAAPSGTLSLIPSGSEGLSSYQKQRMLRVLMAAGYPTYDYAYLGVSQGDDVNAYRIVQAALWYAEYGSRGTYDVYTNYTHNYMRDDYAGYRNLVAVADGEQDPIDKPTVINIDADHGNTMTVDNENDLLISDSIFSVRGVNRYKVQLTGTGAYITVDGVKVDDLGSYVFTNESEFKVVIDLSVAGAGEHTASFKVVQEGYTPTYDLQFFSQPGNWQRMTLLVPKASNPVEASYQVMGNVEMKDVPFAKVDTNGEYISGADLEIYTTDDNMVARFTTINGPKNVQLPQGSYYLTETVNPSGYWFNSEKVYFDVDSLGNATVGGNAVSVVSISDEEAYIALKKVNAPGVLSDGAAGDVIAGATFLIYSPLNSDSYICGKTDSNGFITIADDATCNSVIGTYELTGKTNLRNSTGVYSLADLKYNNLMSLYDLTVVELAPAYGYVRDENEYHISGPYGERIGWYYGENGPAGDVTKETIDGKSVTVFEFRDQRYINISKVDSIGGQEIAGAILKVCRKSSTTGECDTGINPDGSPVYVDYWTSTTQTHKFVGIEKGVRYILQEDYAPEGYIKISGKLEFELVDDNGTVKMYNHETGAEIDNPEKLKAVMPNDTIKTTISKTSAVTGEEIAGAHLKICKSVDYVRAQNISGDGNNCDAVVEWDSTDEEKVIDALAAGDYYLIETIAPRGYKLTNAVSFTVKNDGSLNKVTFENKPITVVISKKDQATGERLAGAHFEILNASDRTIATDFNDEELVWTSDGENDWEIVGFPKGEYILVETQRPEGFQEGMVIDGELVNEYKFTVSDGVSDLEIDAYIQVMNAPNTGISTLNLFAIGGLLVFAGYETIKIYRRKALND